jgi:hypothetical protein
LTKSRGTSRNCLTWSDMMIMRMPTCARKE